MKNYLMDGARKTYLFYRHFDDTATPEEKRELAALLQEHKNEAHVKKLMEESWESFVSIREIFPEDKSRLILENIIGQEELSNGIIELKAYENKWSNLLWKRISIAVSILFVLGASLYYFRQTTFPADIATSKASGLIKDIKPGGSKASLILSDGSIISLDNAFKGVLTRQGNTSVIKSGDGQLSYKVTEKNRQTAMSYNTLKTPRGGHYNLVLPDGSKVWLNAASSIRYPTLFDEKTRKVQITGEVYFEIKQIYGTGSQLHEKIPFMVKVKDVEIEVLGTHFNINAYQDEKSVQTTLLEGSVRIRKGKSKSLLKPGQQASILEKSEGIQVKNVDVNQSIAWKNGFFQFDKTELPEIMRQLTKWYDVTVRYEGKLPDRKFSGEIPRSATLSQVLEILEISRVSLDIEGKKIVVKSQKSNQLY